MEWSDIKVFLQVVRDGTMSEATQSLRMDHSTISRRIARLERDAGVPLFQRAGRRLTLTEEGERLTEAAQKVESIILREVMSLSESHQHITGQVRIGTTEEFGAHYLGPRLARIAGDYHDLEIELVTLPRNFSLATREVDLVVTMDRPTTGDVRFKKLTSFDYGLFCAPEYYGDRSRPDEIADLSRETWCGHIRELLHTQELDLTLSDQTAFQPKFRATSVTAQLAAVLSGYALGFLPCFVARNQPGLERLLPLKASITRDYWLAVHEDLANSPRVRAVMTALSQLVGSDRSLFRDGPLEPSGGARAGNDDLTGDVAAEHSTWEQTAPNEQLSDAQSRAPFTRALSPEVRGAGVFVQLSRAPSAGVMGR